MLLHTLHSRPRVGLKAFARSLVEDDRAGEALAASMSTRMDAPTAARLYEAYLQADALAATPSIPARVLLAFGVHDRMIVEEEARELQAQFPSAHIGLVQGTPGTQAAAREAWIQVQNFLAGAAADDPGARRHAGDAAAAPGALGSAGRDTARGGRDEPQGRGPDPARPDEEALELFQKTIELAPEYDDAQINYRELLSRLVQRRVAQWQTQQAEAMLSQAGRQAARYAKRARKFSLGRLFKPSQARA